MIQDLDSTLEKFLKDYAPPGSRLHASAMSRADVSFDLPDSTWRGKVTSLMVNCYLYDVRENTGLRTQDPIVFQAADGTRTRRRPLARIDCAYCITTWSAAVTPSIEEEHTLLGDVMFILLKYPTIPLAALVNSVAKQLPPYPTLVATPEGARSQVEFWKALDQKLKPSLNYVVTLALQLDDQPVGPEPVRTATLRTRPERGPDPEHELLTPEAEASDIKP